MFFKIQNKQDRLLGFSAKRQTKADCCWDSYLFRSHTLLKLSQLLACQTKNRLWIWQDSCERPCLEIPCRDYRQYGDHLLERNIPLIGHYGLYWPLAINYNAKQRHLLFHSNTISAELNDSLPENCCFSVEIKKIIGYFRFHNNTSASFRDQTVQKIRNFEMSRSLKPINDAPEFDIDGIIFKIACNGFIFFAKLFINV